MRVGVPEGVANLRHRGLDLVRHDAKFDVGLALVPELPGAAQLAEVGGAHEPLLGDQGPAVADVSLNESGEVTALFLGCVLVYESNSPSHDSPSPSPETRQ